MAAILVEPEVERKAGACYATKAIHDAKEAFFDKVDDGKRTAERFVKRGRYAMEDGFEEAVHKVKREPFKYLAIAFGAGAFMGFLMPRFGRRV